MMKAGSLAFDLCLYFVGNPGSVLYTGDIIKRYPTVKPKNLFSQLRGARDNNLIVGVKKKGDAQMYFEAGPALLEALK